MTRATKAPADALDEARALVDVLARKRGDCSIARLGYGDLSAAAHDLEGVVNDAERVLASLCDEFAALRVLVRAYAEAHDARTAHSAQMVRDELWFAERDELNNRVSDALAALRKAAK